METTITDKRYPKTPRTAIEAFEMLPKGKIKSKILQKTISFS
jgi:hypothetical protein